ncbi:hypothetical protein ACFC5Z_25355 [Streptomyces sp. NPDC056004]
MRIPEIPGEVSAALTEALGRSANPVALSAMGDMMKTGGEIGLGDPVMQ